VPQTETVPGTLAALDRASVVELLSEVDDSDAREAVARLEEMDTEIDHVSHREESEGLAGESRAARVLDQQLALDCIRSEAAPGTHDDVQSARDVAMIVRYTQRAPEPSSPGVWRTRSSPASGMSARWLIERSRPGSSTAVGARRRPGGPGGLSPPAG